MRLFRKRPYGPAETHWQSNRAKALNWKFR